MVRCRRTWWFLASPWVLLRRGPMDVDSHLIHCAKLNPPPPLSCAPTYCAIASLVSHQRSRRSLPEPIWLMCDGPTLMSHRVTRNVDSPSATARHLPVRC